MLIGLGYKKQVGKDTVAQLLCDMYDFKRLSFAGPLKELVQIIVRVDIVEGSMFTQTEYEAQLNAWVQKYWGHDVYEHGVYTNILKPRVWCKGFAEVETGRYRKLLQWLGTDVFRDTVDTNFWVKAMARNMHKGLGQSFVITDMRFPNEKNFVEDMGGFAVEVKRAVVGVDEHISENALTSADWKYTIDNNGSKMALLEQIQDLMECVYDDYFDRTGIRRQPQN